MIFTRNAVYYADHAPFKEESPGMLVINTIQYSLSDSIGMEVGLIHQVAFSSSSVLRSPRVGIFLHDSG